MPRTTTNTISSSPPPRVWAARLAAGLAAATFLLLLTTRAAGATEVRVGGLLSDTTGGLLDGAPELPGPLGDVVDTVDGTIDGAGSLVDGVVGGVTEPVLEVTDPVLGPVTGTGPIPTLPGSVPAVPSLPSVPSTPIPPRPSTGAGSQAPSDGTTAAASAPVSAPPAADPSVTVGGAEFARGLRAVDVARDALDGTPLVPSPAPAPRTPRIPDVGGWAFDRLRDEGRTMLAVFLSMCACLLVLAATQLRLFLHNRYGRLRPRLHPRPG